MKRAIWSDDYGCPDAIGETDLHHVGKNLDSVDDLA
jgi:hypothetical protein